MTAGTSENTYAGGAFDDSLPGGKAGGFLKLSEHRMHYRGDAGELGSPLDRMELKRGGAANRLLFFSHPSYANRQFYCSDASILKNVHLQRWPQLAGSGRRIRGLTGARRFGYAALLVAALALVGGIFSLKEAAVGLVVSQIPVEWEAKLGDSVYEQLAASHHVVDDPALNATLQRIVQPVANSADRLSERSYEFRFHIIEDSTINAFALPGGTMVFHTGLILRAGSPEEIAGVAAHELAHVTHQHGMRQMVQSLGLLLIAQALLGDMEGLVGVLVTQGQELLSLKFSRDYEHEADLTGLAYLRDANIDPTGMLSFFEKLQESGSGNMLEDADFLSTHPATADRIEALQEAIEATQKNSPPHQFTLDFHAFQNRLQSHLQQ